MSHFVVAVFSRPDQNYEDLLAPFNEQDENYMEFQPCGETKEELEKTYEEVKAKYGYTSFEQYMKDYHGYHQENGDWGYTSNPHAKWDWYQEGGRWNGFFRAKSGEMTNSELVSEIDFSLNQQVYDRAVRFWEVAVDGQPLKDGETQEDFFIFYKPEYYREQYGTKEKYATQAASVLPWAFVTAEGEWIEKGTMGWWAMNDATQNSRDAFGSAFNKYVADHPDMIITAVDCHI